MRVLIREGAETFVAPRRKRPAVESAINALEHRGLDRVRAHGAGGFERVVGLSVLAFNIHPLGQLVRRRRQVLLKLSVCLWPPDHLYLALKECPFRRGTEGRDLSWWSKTDRFFVDTSRNQTFFMENRFQFSPF